MDLRCQASDLINFKMAAIICICNVNTIHPPMHTNYSRVKRQSYVTIVLIKNRQGISKKKIPNFLKKSQKLSPAIISNNKVVQDFKKNQS